MDPTHEIYRLLETEKQSLYELALIGVLLTKAREVEGVVEIAPGEHSCAIRLDFDGLAPEEPFIAKTLLDAAMLALAALASTPHAP